MVRYTIKLTESEIEDLHTIINKGKHSSQTYREAYILLNCDQGECSQKKLTNQQISNVLKIGMRTIDRVKKKFVEGGLEVALNRRPTTRIYERKVNGDVEAKLIKVCLLADKMVELDYVESISHVTVQKVLKKQR